MFVFYRMRPLYGFAALSPATTLTHSFKTSLLFLYVRVLFMHLGDDLYGKLEV